MEMIVSEEALARILPLPRVGIRALSLVRNSENGEADLEICFVFPGGQAVLSFAGVRALELREGFSSRMEIPDSFFSLSITEISSAQMEGIHWEIDDYEEGELHFFCREISAGGRDSL